MSGKIGVQRRFVDIIGNYKASGVTVCVAFVHCAAHNLNLVINDAAEAIIERIN